MGRSAGNMLGCQEEETVTFIKGSCRKREMNEQRPGRRRQGWKLG